MGAWIEIIYTKINNGFLDEVAPYMGAWIEISDSSTTANCRGVAPYMGAWIEIRIRKTIPFMNQVAPYMGAWIEILNHIKKGY